MKNIGLEDIVVTAGRRAAYPFRQSTVRNLDEDVGGFCDNLSFALQALQLKDGQNTKNETQDIVTTIKQEEAGRVSAGVRNWLAGPDATIDLNRISQKRHATTGQWLVRGSSFMIWLRKENSFLWLHDLAGCGKSVLCSITIHHAIRQQQAEPDSATAFLLFTFNDISKQDESAALRALLLQLFGQIPGLEANLSHLKSRSNHAAPSASVLMQYLQRAIKMCRHVYILVGPWTKVLLIPPAQKC